MSVVPSPTEEEEEVSVVKSHHEAEVGFSGKKSKSSSKFQDSIKL